MDLEGTVAEALDERLPFILDEVAPDLHNDIMPRLQRRDRIHRPADAGDVEIVPLCSWFVDRDLVAGAAGLPHAALLGPRDEHAVAQFSVPGILFEPQVQPIEGALVRQAHRDHHLVLAVGWLLRHGDRRVGLGRVLHHPTRERQWRQRRWAEVGVHADALEADVREQRFALEVIWDLLRLRDAQSVLEQADGVEIRACFIQIEQGRHDVTAREGHACLDPGLVVDKATPSGVRVAIGFEAHAILVRTDYQG
mmetsp:Transcript_80521/g.246103  ORF Transcript_80521/g.246103 Transcript_80521/m.246103 type:complete len:252 (+) Transcript_80521:1490-2245(+)